MHVFDAVLLALTAWTALIILIGILMSFIYRNKPIVKSTIPHINIPIDFLYLGMVALYAQQGIERETSCIVFLWLPFSFAFALGNSYIIKCCRLYVLAISGRLKNMELRANHYYSPTIPDSLSNRHLVEIDIGNTSSDALVDIDSQNKDPIVRRGCCANCDSWFYDRKWLGSLHFLWKLFLVLFILELCIPLAITVTSPQYTDLDAKCTERSPGEMALMMCLIGFYVCIYAVTVLKIWRYKDWFGLRKQLSISAVAWFLVLVGFVIILAVRARAEDPGHADQALAAFCILCWLLPFSADTLWPLFRSRLNHSILKESAWQGYRLGIEEIIQWKDIGKAETGWEALAAFMNEHVNPADAKDNVFLLHGLFFIREFILKKNDITKYWGREILSSENDQLDKELCGVVVLAWMKYLHKKGELVWEGNQDVDAMFLVDFQDIEKVRKQIEEALTTLVRARDFSELSEEDQVRAGRKLRQLYKQVLKKAESQILNNFQKSIQFEHFLRSVKGQVSTIE
jgi:hypothetical protein